MKVSFELSFSVEELTIQIFVIIHNCEWWWSIQSSARCGQI